MNGENQQAYDRGTTIFSPEGRLYQVDYAREAIKQGSPVVGVCGADGVALAANAPARSPLVEASSVEKLHPVDGQVGIATAGHAADGRRLVDIARRTAQGERLRYGEAATVESLAATVADHIQEHTQTGGARPYGTALLVAGHDDGPRLFETDPSGAFDEWRADAVGHDAEEILDYLEDHHEPDLSTEGALALALDGLEAAAEDLDPGAVDAATVDADGYRRIDDEDVVATLAE
jgi:proteasome alpha subunit